jgi:hypothetical protein
MAATVTFDTHLVVQHLRRAGFQENQAEGLTEAIRSAVGQAEYITRQDLQIELAPIRAELKLLHWMVGFNLAMTVAILWKLFGH